MRRSARTALCLASALVAACGGPVAGGPASTPMPAIVTEASFAAFLERYRLEAAAAGISAATLDEAFAGASFQPKVIELDGAQPEFVRPVWAYLDSAVSERRVQAGMERRAANHLLLAEMERRYGVPGSVVTAIWGIESDFGGNFGGFEVIDALATLAFQGRRQDYGRRELLAALRIIQSGDIDRDRMQGSWAGAMGHTQFIPSTFLAHAVDGDGDGRRDIWASLPDVFASTANYLAHSGWRPGIPPAVEVTLPRAFDWALAELDVVRPTADWTALGIAAKDGSALPDTANASIITPAGARGPAFLVTENFRAILRYNYSTAYALAVSTLARRIEGGSPIVGSWPVDETPLSRTDSVELQTLLIEGGFMAGAADGVIGPQTRSGIRAFQRSVGLVDDGFPTQSLLARLRQG